MRTPARASRFLLLLLCGSAPFAWLACGARTPLFVDLPPDAGVTREPAPDAPADTAHAPDTSTSDTTLPPADTSADTVPMIDAMPNPDVVVHDCVDAGATLVYVVSQTNELYNFAPTTGTFTPIGQLDCPTVMPTATPYSMAVDKEGTAYVVFTDGELFQVSTASAACVSTPYVAGQDGVSQFGMGFAGNPSGTGETLFVSPPTPDGTDDELATIDTTTFQVTVLNPIGPQTILQAELTGTGDGRLFAFYGASDANGSSSAVAQLDPTTSTVLSSNTLNALPQGSGWAFAFWGGSFYLFTGTGTGGFGGQHTIVTQFDPATLTQQTVASLSDLVVGAGVSACAPLSQ